MTVCIAAHAEYAGERKIVLCFDWMAGDGLTAMYAGALRDAEELLGLYKKRFALTTLTLENYEDELWAGMLQFKDILSGRGYRSGEPDVQLVVSGFIQGKPKVIYVGHNGVFVQPVFSEIGTGAPAADVILRWRQPSQFSNLREVIYFVYEAKRFAETSPFVGNKLPCLSSARSRMAVLNGIH